LLPTLGLPHLPGAPTPLLLGGFDTGLTLPGYGQAYVAIACILLLTLVNFLGVRFGGLVSDASTFAKAAGLLALVLIVLLFAEGTSLGAVTPLHPPLGGGAGQPFTLGETLAGFSLALTLCLFAYDGWYSATYVAGEVRNPRRNVPLSLLLGPLVTTVVYVAVAFASLYAVPRQDALSLPAGEYLAGRAAVNALGATGGTLVGILALVSIFGTVNAYVLTAPRISYAMARDGAFLRSMGRLDPRRGTPGYGMLLTALWSCLLVFTGLYDQLATMVIFAVFLFHVPTALAHMVLRRRRPDLERPFRTPLGALLPALYLLSSLFVVAATLVLPDYRLFGLIATGIILLGLPAYWLQARHAAPTTLD
ncbi:MAG TPA: APC family permease, partial [Candidatus Thermoplasmatota archaeon]|nr:APC family permease [Candidatus Thermoplasmatota archaeon]